ncbi:NAD(P)-binding protein [Viridothelium virens]|uniref:NAD(P)-binding protein n=1 Tax=Viridothelium virens TaxID=1048519 RepID=A0A6A6H3F4_VIRVR|nr:NAD(P)-binding protein [Viridothelium virens]
MVQNKAVIFKEPPEAMPENGKHLVLEDVGFDLSAVPHDGAILKIIYASFDPYLRGRMRDKSVKSYFPAFDLHAPIATGLIARVVKSSNKNFTEGDIVRTFGPLQEYWAVDKEAINDVNPVTQLPLVEKLSNPHGIDLMEFLGAVGMPGVTAYSSFHEIGKPKKGEVIFISAASGAVGSLVGQLAKHQGLTVYGSVGDDDKLKYIINELGFDGGFNYKKEEPKEALARLAPDGIDIYFENVGGETLQAAFDALRTFGRIIVSGMISQYNLPREKQYRLAGTETIFGRRIKIQGFILGDPDFGPKWGKEHVDNVSQWIAEGSFKTKYHVTRGMDDAIDGLLDIFRGGNFGKAILEVSPPSA